MAVRDHSAPGRSVTRSPAQTFDIGRMLGRRAQAGDVLALSGPLGAGKTIFAKGVAAGLGVTSVVNSPTFVLMNEHHGRLPLFHADVYRLSDPEEAIAAGLLDEANARGVSVIEWADRIERELPADRLDVTLRPREGDERLISWRARGPRHARLAAALHDLATRAA
ncbi:MAG: tRNA (adenosine(37)-N6)-threonylcarbamoyltransferase complex ATPase subunit type 1 TsaE [Candidatus Limnocylindria bacterium]